MIEMDEQDILPLDTPEKPPNLSARSASADSEMAVYREGDAVYYVLLENGKPAEWMADKPEQTLHRLDVHLGQVRQIVPALNCAFINLGSGHDAMLPLADAPAEIKPGSPVIIQIRREAPVGKGPLVTTRIELPGSFAVFRTHGSSKRRSKLAAFPRDVQEQLFADEYASLEQTWLRLVAESESGPVPRQLLAFGAPMTMALNTYVSPALRRIRIEGAELFDTLFRHMRQSMPGFLPLLELHVPTADYGLAAVLSLTHLPDILSKRKVWLDQGGFITIDRTEAMTVIDVNSGKDTRGQDKRHKVTNVKQTRDKDTRDKDTRDMDAKVGNVSQDGRDASDLRLRTNLQAAREIASQLRLRNLGGIIIIDFINMADDAERNEVQAALGEALEADRASSRLLGFTALGLFEMTRTAI